MRIIPLGESSTDERFSEVLYDTMESYFKEGIPPIIDTDPVYGPAKDVSELVRRSVSLPKPERPDAINPAST